MSQIIELQILFSASMVRAILEGRKTVTRRVMKPQPDTDATITVESYNVAVTNRHGYQEAGPEIFGAWWRDGESGCKCPYGKPGDRLWVRETCFINDYREAAVPVDERAECEIIYRADGLPDWEGEEELIRWRSSIHMPRWASRILLEITDVRVERLQDISEEQAQAEGCFFTDYGRKCGHTGSGWTEVGDCQAPEAHHPLRNGWMWDKTSSPNECLGTATWAFANLWQKTGGDWDANPWVWVVEFKRVTP